MSSLGFLRAWRGPSLALQILGLLVGGLIVAQIVTLFLTLLLPPAPPPQYDLHDIAAALGGNARAKLERIVRPGPPDLSGPGWLTSQRSSEELAGLLGAEQGDVRLAFYTPLPFAGVAAPGVGAEAGAALPPGLVPASFLIFAQAGPGSGAGGLPHGGGAIPGAAPLGGFPGSTAVIPGGFPGARTPFPDRFPQDGSGSGTFPRRSAGEGSGPRSLDRLPAGSFGRQPGSSGPERSDGAALAPRNPSWQAIPGATGPILSRGPGRGGRGSLASAGSGQAGSGQAGSGQAGSGQGSPGQGGPPPAAGGGGDIGRGALITIPGERPGWGRGTLLIPGAMPIIRDPRDIQLGGPETPRRVHREPIPVPPADAPPPAASTSPGYRSALARSEIPPPDARAAPPRNPAAPTPPRAPVRPEPHAQPLERPGRALFGLAPAPFVQGDFIAARRLADGRWAIVEPAAEGFPNAWQRRVGLWFLLSFALVAPLGWLFARRLSGPLDRFADAAAQLGRDPAAAIVALDGPAEIGRAAHAFNLMQNRLRSFVDDRTAMVGAISHDLRTPLTRLRFRLEDIDDDGMRDGMLDEVDEMEEMIASVLAFIRDASTPGVRERLDLRTLVDDVAEDAAMIGGHVTVESAAPATVEVDVLGMRRVLANLVENALKYGQRARIRLAVGDDEAIATVFDDGPGLPDEELELVFQPFYRTAAARASEARGTGLGLAVCRSIARAHGGDVRLCRSPEGFMAEVRVPLAFASERIAA